VDIALELVELTNEVFKAVIALRASIVNFAKDDKFALTTISLSADTSESNLRFRTFKIEANAGNK